MNPEFDRWVWRFSEELNLDQTDTNRVRQLLHEFERAVRERIIRNLEAIDRDAYDVKDFTRRVCDLIVEERQSLKGEGDV
jgi:hypothetical protein